MSRCTDLTTALTPQQQAEFNNLFGEIRTYIENNVRTRYMDNEFITLRDSFEQIVEDTAKNDGKITVTDYNNLRALRLPFTPFKVPAVRDPPSRTHSQKYAADGRLSAFHRRHSAAS